MQLNLLWPISKNLWSWFTGNTIILITNLFIEKGAMTGEVTSSESRGKSDGLEKCSHFSWFWRWQLEVATKDKVFCVLFLTWNNDESG